MSPAEQNISATLELCTDIKLNFLRVGKLLYDNFLHGYWGESGFDCWSDYLDSLGVHDRSWLSRLVNVVMCIETRRMLEADVIDMGVSKAIKLLPKARKGKLTPEIIAAAKSGSTRELADALGHKINDNDRDYYVDCQKCGNRIFGAKWVRKDADN